ncbi:MAG TPA: P-type DNA transfer ATPase VirB11 [Xanthobacteraceae bacterium]|jgi:type IV secretion system protein VirB11|nr:P-type DNA transfer ATPase VirB11 [Xanthobacteraceae bacterium]
MGQSELTYLNQYLSPLTPWLEQPDVTDIYVNQPGEIWTESTSGQIERIDVPELTLQVLDRLARQIAAHSHQGISREHPILSATIASGSRVQIVGPPATRGGVALAIRRHVVVSRTLRDYESGGEFELANKLTINRSKMLQALLASNGPAAMLEEAVRQKCNILICGGTSTGKSTFLNALLREIPSNERIIAIEDTPEVQIPHANAVGLLAARSELGETLVSADDLLNASLRMRPDRIILGEIRGREAFTFLRAINTGHPGSMSTIHADSPGRALEQLALLVLQSGTQLRRSDVIAYTRSVLDVIVQIDRSAGRRSIKNIELLADAGLDARSDA